MKLFKHSQGFIIAFGFDPVTRQEAPRKIRWCDPQTGEWECKASNLAGWIDVPNTVVDPEFIFENGAKVIAYQPGLCYEMQLIGAPLVWGITILRPDNTDPRAIAA